MKETKNDVFVSFSFKDFDLVKRIVATLEERYGFHVWMCSEELHGGDRYFKIIPKEIRDSRVLLFIQSKNSLESKEVPSEILIARNANITIIPFRIDRTDIEDSEIEYFLVVTNYIDGTQPTFDNRVDDLSQSIYATLDKYSEAAHVRINFREKLLSTKMVFPTKGFVGRKDIVDEIEQKYQEGHHVVFLKGIGGIGKTQIAKKYVFDHKLEYDTIVFATYGGNIKTLINNESPFVLEPTFVRKMKDNGQLETDDELFIRKLNKTREH